MTADHPFTPPPELVRQWYDEARDASLSTPKFEKMVATRAAQWGADQELEECCKWLDKSTVGLAELLRAARRPKPPSLKEQSLALIDLIQGNKKAWDIRDLDVVRLALEAMPND